MEVFGDKGGGLALETMNYPLRVGMDWGQSHYDNWVTLDRVKQRYQTFAGASFSGEPDVVMTFPCHWWWSTVSGAVDDADTYKMHFQTWDDYERINRPMDITVRIQ